MLLVTLAPLSHVVAAPGHSGHTATIATGHGHTVSVSSGLTSHHGTSHDHVQETFSASPTLLMVEKIARTSWLPMDSYLVDNRLNWVTEHRPKLLA